MLTLRQERVLGLVVREYTATANPVGSEALAMLPGLTVSSATIRNEMAALEDEGYLTHPHPSAGRMPTEQGYRYFVEYLMTEEELSPAEKRTIRHQFHQSPLDLGEWLRLACSVLANSTHAAALATPPRPSPKDRDQSLERLELVNLDEERDLLILLLGDGGIRQEIIAPSLGVAREEMALLAEELSLLFRGRGWQEIPYLLPALLGIKRAVADRVASSLRGGEVPASEIFHDGLENILHQPEFSEAERIESVLWLLEEKQGLGSILSAIELSPGNVEVLIGGEGQWPQMHDYALVLAPYAGRGEAMGTLGILGPLRLPYERTVPAVRYLAELMTDFLSTSMASGMMPSGF